MRDDKQDMVPVNFLVATRGKTSLVRRSTISKEEERSGGQVSLNGARRMIPCD